jgi:hypothetical protein
MQGVLQHHHFVLEGGQGKAKSRSALYDTRMTVLPVHGDVRGTGGGRGLSGSLLKFDHARRQ